MRMFRVDFLSGIGSKSLSKLGFITMIETTVALVLFLFPLAYSPGPGNMFFAANGARFGFRATVPANIGYHIATWIVTAAIGFGFVAALDRFPQIFTTLKAAGSLYVLWIAWKMFRAGMLEGNETAKPVTFRDGVILLILNGKAYVIIALMFTQFLNKSEMETVVGILFFTTVFTFNNMIAFTVWTMIGDRIAGYFRTPKSAKILNIMFGGILAAVAVWMLQS